MDEVDKAIEQYVKACLRLASNVSSEEIASYISTWRTLRDVAHRAYGRCAAFATIEGLLRVRYDRITLRAINIARTIKEAHPNPGRVRRVDGGGGDGQSDRIPISTRGNIRSESTSKGHPHALDDTRRHR